MRDRLRLAVATEKEYSFDGLNSNKNPILYARQNLAAKGYWWDMNQFFAESFVRIVSGLAELSRVYGSSTEIILKPESDTSVTHARVLELVAGSLDEIGCRLSKKASERLMNDLLKTEMKSGTFFIRAQELSAIITDEMRDHLFLWVPSGRAHFYGKTGEEILGAECLQRFQKADVGKEAERAARCYAFGEWTACGFHMVRIGDAGVRAFALAIQYTGTFNWGGVYNAYVQQRDLKPENRPAHWQGNHDFLESIADFFRAIKPYRDETQHFRMVYEDKDAEHMMSSIPAFMRHLASRIDEEGAFV